MRVEENSGVQKVGELCDGCGEMNSSVGCGEGHARKGKGGQPSCPPARGTRTIGMCSFDARNRGSTRPSSKEVGTRAWKGWGGSGQVPLRARGIPTMTLWSFDTRSKGQPGYSRVVAIDDL
jgi:hypothetical protein